MSQSPRTFEYVHLQGKRRSKLAGGIKPTSQVTWKQEIILDYSSWPNVITRALKDGRGREVEEIWGPTQRSEMCYVAWEDGRMGWEQGKQAASKSWEAMDGSCLEPQKEHWPMMDF